MKVLFITDTYPPHVNGAAIATSRIVNGLHEADVEVAVIAPSASLKNETVIVNGIKIYRIASVEIQKDQKYRVPPQTLFYRRSLRNIIQEVDPDVIHINHPFFLGAVAVFVNEKLGYPIVGTVHFMPENIVHYLHLPRKAEDILSRVAWRQYARLFSKLDCVLCPTETSANLLKQNKLQTTIHVVSNGIDLSRFKSDKKSGILLRKKLNVPEVPLALFVGRLDKEKNIDVFLRAAAEIKEKANFHVVIAGKGKEYEGLVELTKELELDAIVTFTGYLSDEDLSKIYNIADIFIMPGIAELQSLVTMEAMATGIPILAANAVALPHLVKDDINGYLFNPGDEHDLAEKLLKLIDDAPLRKKLGEGSLRMIKEHDITNVIKRTIAIYESVVGQSKKGDQIENKRKQIRRIRDGVSRIRHVASRIVN